MFNRETIYLVFIGINFAVSQGFQPLADILENSTQSSVIANNETSLSLRQALTLFSRFVKAQEQFFHFDPDKH